MVLRGVPPEPPAGVVARPVASVDELRTARRVQHAAFASTSAVDEVQLRLDHERRGSTARRSSLSSTASSSRPPTPRTRRTDRFSSAAPRCPTARGRGAYRALVAARAAEAAARGAPAVVTHAGRMSLPILERLGFERVARIDRLLDVL
jgi:hypothetical protein